ncbi:MAG: UDP-glucose 4-epimerase, partial [Mycobacterium sp.]|nr:UDP-glucose 4-epimerase [Mycobacterium sp.]
MTGLTDAEVRELFRGTRCLVTGGLGFIGSNVALALCEGGADVTIVDALVPRHGGNVNNIAGASPHFIVADMGDSAAVTEPLSRAQYVFNVAGQVSHVDSMQDPLADLEVNGRSQLAFLELVRRTNPEAVVVYTSTRQVYGRPRYLPVDETHPVDPVDVNGVAKYAAEQFHRIYHDVHRIRTVSLRITNVYGPRQRLTGDHQGFIPVCVRCALEGHPIRIYGDGDHERDCLYVS